MIGKTRAAAIAACCAWLLGATAARAAVTTGYTTLSCTQVQFWANGVGWADLHYTVNGGGQLNVRMTQSGASATYTVSGLSDGGSVQYFFTYVPSGSSAAVDTAWTGMTVSCGGGTTYTLSVGKAGAGAGTVSSTPAGISCGATCSASYASGTSVTLTAAPAGGSTFAGWSGACTGTGTCNTTMTAARAVTATFNASGGGDACTACKYHTLVWADEFDGSGQPDASSWSYHVGNGYNAGAFSGWGNGEWEWYRPEECYRAGGNLVLRAEWLSSPLSIGGRSWYQKSCRITTQGKRSWNNARVEARISMPSRAGTWPAFWMLGDSYDGTVTASYAPGAGAYDTMASNWASCGEIDIMEHKNTEGVTYQNLFWDTRTGVLPWSGSNVANNPGSASVPDVAAYHTYAMEWDASNMYWYVDNVRVKTQSVSASTMEEYRQRFFVILNLALGGQFPGTNPVQGDFPLYMYVDYVRVYQ